MPQCSAPKKIQLSLKKERDLSKRYTDGHKVLTALDAAILRELQGKERRMKDDFDSFCTTKIKDRNPLTGEETPREGKGETIFSGYKLEKNREVKEMKVTDKIGFDATRDARADDIYVRGLRSRKDQVQSELDKLARVVALKEAKLRMSLERNRLAVMDGENSS